MAHESGVHEAEFFFSLLPKFKEHYRAVVSKAAAGDAEALLEQHRLIDMLTRRINAHLGDGMEKPKGIKYGRIG